MAGYDPKGKRARSAKPAGDSTVPIDAMLNATGEHAVTNVDPTPTPPDGVSLVDFEAATLPPEASREGKRNTEDTEAVVVDPVDVEPIDQAAADDPEDPTPPEAPLPLEDVLPAIDDLPIEDGLPSAPKRREPLVPAAAPPDEDDRRLLIAAGAVLVVTAIAGVIAWRRKR
jgi:hypothetical protein